MATSKQLALNYDCNESLNRMYTGDPFRIRQIAENLLSNALKFTEEGSITLRAALENGQLHFSITDTGCGYLSEIRRMGTHPMEIRVMGIDPMETFIMGTDLPETLIMGTHPP